MKRTAILICVLAVISCCETAFSQKAKPRRGIVCGDPAAACKFRNNFQPHDLAFDTGKNFVIVESEPFYGIVLKSVKLPDFGDCDHPSFKESERAEIQKLFDHNKVFMQNCMESGSNYYPGVPEKSAFIGVYAGRTLAEANKFLSSVQALGQFTGIRVRKMRVAINGT